MSTIKKTAYIGDMCVTIETDVYDGQKGDTKITHSGNLICWVSGSEIDKFIEEIADIITKYRI